MIVATKFGINRKQRDPRPRAAVLSLKRLAISAAIASLVIPLAASATAMAEPLPRCSDQGWVGVWAAAPSDAAGGTSDFDRFDLSNNPKPVVRNMTIRAILTPTSGATTARVRLSNRFGTAPVTFTQATIARRAAGPEVVSGTNGPLTFGGSRSVTVASGQDVVSDPVQFSFQAFRAAGRNHVPGR